MSRIASKLTAVQIGFDNERSQRLETVDNRIRSIEERFFDFQDSTNKKLTTLKDMVVRMNKNFEEDRSNRDNLAENKLQEAVMIDQKLGTAFEEEIIVN